MPIARLSATLLFSAALAACSGVGDGTRPVSMKLVDGQTGEDEIVLFQCFERSVGARVTFSDGVVSDFLTPNATRPVDLFSSDESVLRVSNGDVPIPGRDGVNYPRGSLIPVAPGTARITARFSDLQAEAEVTVRRPDSIRVEPQEQTIAIASGQVFALAAELDGVRSNATVIARWSLEDATGDAVDEEIGQISPTTGTVLALADHDGLTVRATLSGCADGLPSTVDPADLQASVRFKPATALELTREFAREDDQGDPLPAPPLVQNTSEAFYAIASFADASFGTQDLSAQVRYAVVDPSVPADPEETTPTRAIFGLLGVRNLLSSLGPTEAGLPLQVSARFGGPSDDEEETEEPPLADLIVSNTLPVTVIAARLESLAIDPVDVVLPRFGQQGYHAIGRFTDADGAEYLQDIRRHVNWTSSAPTVATISSTATLPALAQAILEEPGCTRIRARALVPSSTEGEAVREVVDETLLFVVDDTVACATDDDED